MNATLLQLLEQAHPDKTPEQLKLMLDGVPDRASYKASKIASQKPAGSRSGSRPRTDASMERRRSWAFSGRLPQRIAARFTLAETAVLAVIAVQVVKHAACTLTVPHIAALAGVSETTVRNAIREAKAMGLVTVEERRKTAWVSYPNTVRIVSPEWCVWLRLTGAKPRTPRLQEITKPSESRATMTVSKAAEAAGGRSREERTRIQPRVRE